MKVGKMLLIVVGALVIIIIGLALFNNNKNVPTSYPKPVVTFSPKPAPDFKLKLFSGENIALSDFKGNKPVVINFWASWCAPCREEAPTLAKVSRMYGGRIEFIGVVEGDTQAKALAFIDEFGIPYNNGIDQDNIGTKYGITGIPETFWINRQGQVVDHWIGAIDEANLTTRIQKLLE